MAIPPLKKMIDDLGTVTLVRHANDIYEAKCGGKTELGGNPEGALFHLWDRNRQKVDKPLTSDVLTDTDIHNDQYIEPVPVRGPIYLAGAGVEVGEIPDAGQS
ncbi:hypothetical protein [Burkholderia sp. BCC0097]|uniref:hypothetical protein n=1 Tax=Burkholderia sp. BCC0097 TaxID=2676289 RepID=UPI00158DC843|nr:hypothetical protein [Burkholderia sp. BCC0097]